MTLLASCERTITLEGAIGIGVLVVLSVAFGFFVGDIVGSLQEWRSGRRSR